VDIGQICNYIYSPQEETQPSAEPSNDGGQSFFTRETAQRLQKYTRKWQVNKPYKAMETRRVAVPRCTVVAGQIDLYTGGKGAKTPMRKLIP